MGAGPFYMTRDVHEQHDDDHDACNLAAFTAAQPLRVLEEIRLIRSASAVSGTGPAAAASRPPSASNTCICSVHHQLQNLALQVSLQGMNAP